MLQSIITHQCRKTHWMYPTRDIYAVREELWGPGHHNISISQGSSTLVLPMCRHINEMLRLESGFFTVSLARGRCLHKEVELPKW